MDKEQARIHFKCSNNQPILTILGGSQGSVPLNRHFQESCNQYTDSGIQLLWQCGKNQYDSRFSGAILEMFASGCGATPQRDGVDTGANRTNPTSTIADIEMMEMRQVL